jgi:hypothetical protein
MRIAMTILALAAMALPAGAIDDAEVVTLYRNSPADSAMRIHMATFDAGDGKDYNSENCWIIADMFQRANDPSMRYWCEPGRFRQ